MFARFRRQRFHPVMRELVRQTRLHPSDFIYPLFVKRGEGVKDEVASMPGVYQMSIDMILKECDELKKLGLYAVILFGIPDVKDSIGSDALCEHGIIADTVRAIKHVHPDMFVITDVCFCEYTDHGHCGVINPALRTVDNDITLQNLSKQAVVHAKAGADMVAPSGMMDGMVSAIREGLDMAGFDHIPIMSYSSKFASAYYGPFRDVAQSSPSFGDRRSYQMDPANSKEAVAESIEDALQGADVLMVKPALAYLDIVKEIRNQVSLPLAVYNVSGEYSMLKAAAKAGVLDYDAVLMETLISFKRAGADMIITYHAKEATALLENM